MINFPKYSISLKVTQILNIVSHIPGSKIKKYPISLEVKWQISCISKPPIQASEIQSAQIIKTVESTEQTTKTTAPFMLTSTTTI